MHEDVCPKPSHPRGRQARPPKQTGQSPEIGSKYEKKNATGDSMSSRTKDTRSHTDAHDVIFSFQSRRSRIADDITEPTHLLHGSLQKRLSRNSRGARSGSTFLISEPSGYRILVLSMCGAARRQLVFCLFTERQVVGKASCFLSCARITLCWRSAAA